MSTKEKIITKINFLTDEQIEALYSLLNSFYPEEIYNKETLEAFDEVEEMKRNPEQYKGVSSVEELFKELRD